MIKLYYLKGREVNIMDFKKVEKELYKLKIPKDIKIPKVSILDKVTYAIFMSERASAKTTNFLLAGLFLTKYYGVVTQYVRIKREYITASKMVTLYDVVKEFGYIKKIFGDEYDDIIYDKLEHTFYLSKEGDKITPCCVCLNLEDGESYKSGYNAPHGDFIIFDEFLIRRERIDHPDQFFDLVSTIFRKREGCKVVMLGNTITRNSYFYDKMEINRDIRNMHLGDSRLLVTTAKTKIYVEMMQGVMDEKKKNYISEYFGFKDMEASITGYADFNVKKYPSIERDRDREVMHEIVLKINEIDFISVLITNIDVLVVRCTNLQNKKIYTCDRLDREHTYGIPSRVKRIIEKAYTSNILFFMSDNIADDFFNYFTRLKNNK